MFFWEWGVILNSWVNFAYLIVNLFCLRNHISFIISYILNLYPIPISLTKPIVTREGLLEIVYDGQIRLKRADHDQELVPREKYSQIKNKVVTVACYIKFVFSVRPSYKTLNFFLFYPNFFLENMKFLV